MRNEIQKQGEIHADATRTILEALEADYWRFVKELPDTAFKTSADQREAIRKVSQLGLALHEMGKAYSATSAIRCN